MFTKFRMKEEKGFTLIELLIVVAIIGILAAIAIPQFGAYRRRGYNTAAVSDLRTIRTTEEAMMADFQDYGASHTATATYDNTGVVVGTATTAATVYLSSARTTTTVQTVSLSKGVSVIAHVLETAGVNTTYLAKSTHAGGDQIYGSESDVTSIYRSNCAAAGACNTTSDLIKAPNASTIGAQYSGDAAWIQM